MICFNPGHGHREEKNIHSNKDKPAAQPAESSYLPDWVTYYLIIWFSIILKVGCESQF